MRKNMRKKFFALTLVLILVLCSCGKKEEPISGKKETQNTSAPTGEVKNPTKTPDSPKDTPTVTPTATSTPTATPTPTEPLLPEGTKVMSVKEENFSALIPDYSTFKYVKDDGTYIYTSDFEGIPYVYFNVLKDMPIGPEQFLEESVVPSLCDAYGDKMYEMGTIELQEDEETGLRIYGVPYRYDVSGTSVSAFVVAMEYKDVLLRITAKCVTGDKESEGNVNEALEMLVESFRTDADYYNEENWQKIFGKITDDIIQVIPDETQNIVFTDYSEPTGYFTMKIPEGWVVKTGALPDYIFDIISYGIHVYDPKNPERQFYFNLNNAGFTKSKEAHDWYNKYYPNEIFATSPYLTELTTAGFFKAVGDCFGYYDFDVTENLGTTPLNGDLLIADCRSAKNDKPMKGLFTGYVTSIKYMVNSNPINIFSSTIDAGWVTVYTIIMETAGKNELTNWQPIYDAMFSSIKFTDKFNQEREATWKKVMGSAYQAAAAADEISDILSDSWDKRNKSEEIISQKYSDAIMGIERVEDTETGEIYTADIGFMDRYYGQRYIPITDDKYSEPTVGRLK